METSTVQAETSNFKRAVAVKARIADLLKGKWQEKLLELPSGESVSRVRLMATIIGKFASEDGKYATITLDDSTSTIRTKTWDNVKLFEKFNIGEVVDLIGRIKSYNDEIYVVSEILRKVDDPNMEVLRKLELVKKYGPVDSAKPEKKDVVMDKNELRKQILKMIEDSKDGVSYSEILDKIKGQKAEMEQIIDDLLLGGLCYESSPGVIKKI